MQKIKSRKHLIPLDLVKSQIRVCSDADNEILNHYIGAATEHVEKITGLAISKQTIILRLNGFDAEIMLKTGEANSIASIKYYDTNNSQKTLSNTVYYLDDFDNTIKLQPNQSWPSVYSRDDSIEIEYIANLDPLPKDVESAVLLMVGDLYENRESSIDINLYENKAFFNLLVNYMDHV